MFRFAHPELLYLLIVIPLLIVFYVVMIRRKKKAIAEFGNPELLGPLMPLLSFSFRFLNKWIRKKLLWQLILEKM
jgi:Ca-activated chloride channel family protein